MADINRKTVDYLVLHHSVTPTWENWSKAQVAQWFSDNGFARVFITIGGVIAAIYGIISLIFRLEK